MTNSKSFNNIPALIKALPSIMEKSTEAAGIYYAGEVDKKIIAQDPTWQPKAESTLKSEGAGKTKLWVNTGDLRSELHQQTRNVNKSNGGNKFAVQVGVFSESRVKAAQYLEHGSPGGKIVARPLFGPVFDVSIGKIQKVQVLTINKQLSKYLRK